MDHGAALKRGTYAAFQARKQRPHYSLFATEPFSIKATLVAPIVIGTVTIATLALVDFYSPVNNMALAERNMTDPLMSNTVVGDYANNWPHWPDRTIREVLQFTSGERKLQCPLFNIVF